MLDVSLTLSLLICQRSKEERWLTHSWSIYPTVHPFCSDIFNTNSPLGQGETARVSVICPIRVYYKLQEDVRDWQHYSVIDTWAGILQEEAQTWNRQDRVSPPDVTTIRPPLPPQIFPQGECGLMRDSHHGFSAFSHSGIKKEFKNQLFFFFWRFWNNRILFPSSIMMIITVKMPLPPNGFPRCSCIGISLAKVVYFTCLWLYLLPPKTSWRPERAQSIILCLAQLWTCSQEWSSFTSPTPSTFPLHPHHSQTNSPPRKKVPP